MPSGPSKKTEAAADVVHLVAQHLHAVGDEVVGDRVDVVDAEGEVVVAAPAQVRRLLAGVRAGIGSNASSWISKCGSAPSSTSVMCSAFMSGMPM